MPTSRPGERFVYSDINFFLLGDLVQRVSGVPLDRFAREHIFEPLGMRDTVFNPPASLVPRIAPTESCTRYGWPCQGPDMTMLRGVVHDPTARRMGGVAGHAGLFSTAADLATFCRMLLAGGVFQSARILSPLAVEKMTSAASPDLETNTRGLGWDIDSTFSSNRGELLPIGSFGHTGFTGTSIWIDPSTGMFVVFLSNRVHPDGKGDVTPLRARVATVAAAAVTSLPAGGARGGLDRPRFRRVRHRRSASVAAGAERARRAARRGLRAAARQARRPRHQPHRPRARRRDDDRCAVRGQGREARRALQPRARHPRHRRRKGRVVDR